MDTEDIIRRVRQGEDSRTQFKREAIGVARLAEELTAFANADGGVILFGVDDDGTVVGLGDEQRSVINRDLSNAANDGVRPAVYPRTEFHEIDGKIVLAVLVPEGSAKPYADKSGAYWTKSGPDKRRIVAREELQRLLQRSLLVHADEMPVPNSTLEDVDRIHLGEFLERNYEIPRKDVLSCGKVDVPQVLSNLGLMSGSQLTLAGLMLFGIEPQRRSPVNVVKAVWFKGDDSSVSEYYDSEDIGGSIRDMYKGTMAFLRRCLHHVQDGQDFNSLGVLEVPEDALKELVVNMFLHRDYFVSAPWRVFVFDNRIELISPGSLPNHLSIAQMKAGVSIPRNPLLFSLAVKDGIPYRGIGTGVRRAVALVPDIAFENDPDGFFVKTVIKLTHSGHRVSDRNVESEGRNVAQRHRNVADGNRNVMPQHRNVVGGNRNVADEGGKIASPMKRLVMALGEDEVTALELMKRLGIASRGALSITYTKPGLTANLLEMRYPNSRQTRKQAYRLTKKGLALLSSCLSETAL